MPSRILRSWYGRFWASRRLLLKAGCWLLVVGCWPNRRSPRIQPTTNNQQRFSRSVNDLPRQRLQPVHYFTDRLLVDPHGVQRIDQVIGHCVEMLLLDFKVGVG